MTDDPAKRVGRPPGSGAPPFDWRAPRGHTVATMNCPACGRPMQLQPSDKGRLSAICPHAYGDLLEPCNTKVFFGIPHSRALTSRWHAARARPADPAPDPKPQPEPERKPDGRSFLGRPL